MVLARLISRLALIPIFWCGHVGANASWNEWQAANPKQLDSLSNQTITLVRKVGKREIWVASTDGVFVFNGSGITAKDIRWRKNDKIPLKRVLEIAKGNDGTIFVFSIEDGIFKLLPSSREFEQVTTENLSLSISKIESVAISQQNQTALILSDGRLLSLNLRSSQLSEVPLNIKSPREHPMGVLSDIDGSMYAIFDKMVLRLTWQIDRYAPYRSSRCTLEVPSVMSYAPADHGEFYIADKFGNLHHVQLQDDGCSRLAIPEGTSRLLSSARVNSVAFLNKSRLLAISTDHGLQIVSDDAAYTLAVENSRLRSDEITCVEEIADGNILVGTFRGLVQATRSSSIVVTKLPGELSPTITAIDSSANTLNTFVASYKGLYRAKDSLSGVAFEAFALGDDHVGISALAVFDTGLWVGLQSGSVLYCAITTLTKECTEPRKIVVTKSPITSLAKTHDSTSILATTLDGKVLAVSLQKNNTETLKKSEIASLRPGLLSVKQTVAGGFFFDLDGAWLTPVTGGIGHRLASDGEKFELDFVIDSWTMASTKDEVFFASPTGQVSSFNKRVLVNASTRTPSWTESVPDTIFAIEIDHLGRPWVATKSGLWLSHNMRGFGLEVPTSGFNSVSLDYGASHSNIGRDLYFGGTGGLVIVREPSDHPRQVKSRATVTGVWVEDTFIRSKGDPLIKSALVKLKTSTKKLMFELGVEDVLPPKLPVFQHKLEGFDRSWQNTGNNNVVSYNNLPAGNYIFKARAANSTGVWSENEIALPVQVNPPDWQSRWAVSAYGLLLVAVFIYLKRANDRSVMNRARLKLAEEGAAAFSRLEDDYQEQREANEALLRSRAPAARTLLGAIEASLLAHQDKQTTGESAALIAKIQALDSLQSLTSRTSSAERTDLHALTDEIAAQLSQSSPLAADALISNEVTREAIPLEHAIYLCLVIQEALTLATTARHFEPGVDPIVLIRMEPPIPGTDTGSTYQLRVDDTGLPDQDAHLIDNHLPLTLHLIEANGGDMSQTYDAGNELAINLVFPSILSEPL